jgi:hypothetical protein
MKARRSWNELTRTIIWRSRLSRRSAQTSGPGAEEGVELKAWQVFLEALSATATSLSNTANSGLVAEEGVQLKVWQVFLEGLSATATSLSKHSKFNADGLMG